MHVRTIMAGIKISISHSLKRAGALLVLPLAALVVCKATSSGAHVGGTIELAGQDTHPGAKWAVTVAKVAYPAEYEKMQGAVVTLRIKNIGSVPVSDDPGTETTLIVDGEEDSGDISWPRPLGSSIPGRSVPSSPREPQWMVWSCSL
jgi:archaellum component FlaG (FlaF/FlaG flagellin family)